MTRRLSPREKLQRKPALRACTFCHSKHLQCSNTRPCQNCIKRKIEHECQDVVRKRALYLLPPGQEKQRGLKNSGNKSPDEQGATHVPTQVARGPFSEPPRERDESTTAASSDFSGPESNNSGVFNEPVLLPKSEPDVGTFNLPLTYAGPQTTMGSAPTSLDTFHEHNLGGTQESTPSTTANFNSMFLNQEYMMLGDLISKPSSPSLEFAAAVPGAVLDTNPDFFGGLDTDDSFDTRPYISLGDGVGKSARENGFNFDLLAHDDHEYVSPLLSHHIYQTVQDIYSNRIINFDYPLSYHSLTHFLKSRFSVTGRTVSAEEKNKKRSNLLVILKLIASYRPTFISVHKSLFQPFDFQFLEMSFQRCLLDFENLSRLNASPMIIWRRTGEIVLMSAHLANLLGLNSSDVLSKRTFIMELMYDDESIVEYFRLFKSVAIGSLHLTIFTKCKLIKKPSDNHVLTSKTNARLGDVDFIEFCSVWTVKRDLFDLPMMIVGHFLPSLPNNDAIRSY